jgi:hypothetical protein
MKNSLVTLVPLLPWTNVLFNVAQWVVNVLQGFTPMGE